MRCYARWILRILVFVTALVPGTAAARLVVDLTARGPFVYGQAQTVDVVVTNTGPRNESGPVTVVLALPPKRS